MRISSLEGRSGFRITKMVSGQVARLVTLMIAVSVLAFTLVTLSPVDPVQQYLIGVPDVSAEQRAAIEEYWGVNEPPVQRFV